MKKKLIINVGSVLVVLILVSFRFMSHWQMSQLAIYENKQDFTFSVIQNLDHLLKITADVRNEKRHFIRSRDEKYLESYYKSLEEARQELKLLKATANDIPWLQKRVEVINKQVEEKLGEYAEQIKLGTERNSQVASNGNDTRTKMSAIRENASAAKEEAVMHMQDLAAKQRADFNKMQNLTVINSFLIFILVTAIFLVLKRDIASRIKMNEHVGVIQEQERLALSREVHDEIGQSLAALKLDLTLIEHRLLPGDSEMVGRLSEMRTNLDQLLTKTNDITAKLRPPLLDNLGLADAIEWQVNEFRRRSSIEYHLMLNESIEAYDPHVGLAIIRILQEALTNVIRHSRATEVSISMCERGDEFILEISDNGCGTTSKEIDSSKSFGIMGMRERALLCNGKVTIKGNSDNGTIVSLTIPRDALKEKNETDIDCR
jgi:signal transduction histidine kinase